MKKFFYLLTSLVFVLLSPSLLQAQWLQTSGPYGGYPSCFAEIDTNLFTGTENDGVFLSTNNGTSWTQVNNGLANTNVYALAVSGTNLFAGTFVGVWQRPLSQMITSVESFTNELPKNFSLAQNYPNPFNPTTKIKYSIPTRSYVTLKVYDMLGKEVTTLVNEEKATGNYEINWDGNKFASGIYFYQIKAGSFVQTKKMVLLK